MKRLTKFITHYFSLSPKETKGFMVLATLLMLSTFLPYLYRTFFFEPYQLLPSDQKILDSLLAYHLTKDSVTNFPTKENINTTPVRHYQPFDPNSASQKQMEQSGIPAYLASRIIKFRSKGGVFKNPEDLLKIYGFDQTIFQKIKPSIILPLKTFSPTHHAKMSTSTQKKTVQPFDINLADSAQFCLLKGIGPARSQRIVRYRTLLGGFVHFGQLHEIYGLDSTALQQLEEYTYIHHEFVPIRKNINERTLLVHPYLDKKTAGHILQYRMQHRDFRSTEQLLNIRTMEPAVYEKLAPYLSVD